MNIDNTTIYYRWTNRQDNRQVRYTISSAYKPNPTNKEWYVEEVSQEEYEAHSKKFRDQMARETADD